MTLVRIVRRAAGSPWELHWVRRKGPRLFIKGEMRPIPSVDRGEFEARVVTLEAAREDYGVCIPYGASWEVTPEMRQQLFNRMVQRPDLYERYNYARSEIALGRKIDSDMGKELFPVVEEKTA